MASKKNKNKDNNSGDTPEPANTGEQVFAGDSFVLTKENGNVSAGFPIVGIGASAGGLEALELFFKNMPNNNGMAFVVIQHLDPNHIGIMPELLQRLTAMTVFQASDDLIVKPNCVYVIPPNKSLFLLNGTLKLLDPVETRGLRLPIDIFFRSLADDKQDKSIGIILSGMGSDGSLGIKAIKEKDGTVLVQSPETSKFDGMPRSAIESVIADIVAPAEELPAKLIEYLKFIPRVATNAEIDSKAKSNLEKIILLLREQTGHDFSLYKKNTLFRRIDRRRGIHQIDKIQTYVRFLQDNPKEIEILFKELLIGVTSFFRDTAVWETLKENVLPDLISELPNGYVMRAWVPACSTGEEAYSLAIIFKEAMDKIKKNKNITLQVFATDLDSDAIEIARKGIFPANIEADVSVERLNRFFTPVPGGFRVNTGIREMVVLAPQNVIKDPPFTKLDFLSCRNMLIYMEPELQKKLVALFHYCLNPGGIMVFGTAETIGYNNEKFQELDGKLKFFYRSSKGQETSELLNFPSSFHHPKVAETEKLIQQQSVESIQNIADQIMLQRFAPASVLVNDKGDIIYITGRTGKYLELSAGKANWNIYSMAREGLRHELPGAFRKAMQHFDPVHISRIRVGANGNSQIVNITVQRFEAPDSIRGMIMVVFSDVAAVIEPEIQSSKHKPRSSSGRQKELEMLLQRGNEDLQSVREEMRSTQEEMQTSQEELKSTNEELQSTNEELQSTNEELNTSKEEMLSLNEELQTVNLELQSKVNDFGRANDDMKNLLNSTEIATLFLDKDLNIRRFTDQVTKIFKLRSTDIGRPFTDLVTNLQYPEMGHDAIQVLTTLVFKETRVAADNGAWFNIRILPYRTLDDRIEGLVITFTDITKAKKVEEALLVSEAFYRQHFESAKDGILFLDAETGKIKGVNSFLTQMLGCTSEEFIEKAIWEIGLFKGIAENKEKIYEVQQKEFVRYNDLSIETTDGRKINAEVTGSMYLIDSKKVIQFIFRETAERKKTEEALREARKAIVNG